MEGNNLLVVAHPDDEVLFAHSLLLGGNWHVVCATGANRATAAQFRDVMSLLGLTYDLWEHDDSWNGTFVQEEVGPLLGEVLSRGFDNVLTHNEDGEYGHTQHAALHSILRGLVGDDLLVFDKTELLSFDTLYEKMQMLSIYEGQRSLRAWDWYDLEDPENRTMKWVVSEGYRRVGDA